ncbi:MAG: RluA family pseudouridine synthase [Clostridia bacterium]|nr:RluA family pseudouridine synthase [Clostridia bacterium]
METVFEDAAVIVCIKPAGAASQDDGTDLCMPALLRKKTGCKEIYPVHRLDTGAAGLTVFAKTRAAAAGLSRQAAEGRFRKEYLCAVHGVPEKEADVLEDLLFKDGRKNKTYVVTRERKGVKQAKLSYRTLETVFLPDGPVSVLRVRLFTGRTHQIRVQFASRRLPLLGDGKYGAADHVKNLALFCCSLSFLHPETGEALTFERTTSFL